MGKAISADWFFRSSTLPPKRASISPKEVSVSGVHAQSGAKAFEFVAFNKRWRLEGVVNTALYSPDKTTFEVRTEFGKTLSTSYWDGANCFYIGRVSGGSDEAGVAAFSTCHGLRALLVTNVNDYVIKPTTQQRLKRTLHDQDGMDEHFMEVEPRSTHGPEAFFQQQQQQQQRPPTTSQAKSNTTIHSPVWDPLVGPAIPNMKTKDFMKPGTRRPFAVNENKDREIVVELGIIVDQEYLDKVKSEENEDPEWLKFHFFERINWVQLWYIHPTFGYVWWWHIQKVIINDQVIDYKKYEGEVWDTVIDKVCYWQSVNQPDSESWDHTLIFSSKPHIWGTRANGNEYIGRALADGACDKRKHCVGVKDMTYQWATWTRLAAHENAHGFGIPDDYPESGSPTSAECYAGLMRLGVYQDHEWGRCSVEWFEAWKEEHGACLDVVNGDTLDGKNDAFRRQLPNVPVNVAYRAEASQSSRFGSAEEFGAQKATDGPLLSTPQGLTPDLASCTMTKRQTDPYIFVKLDKAFHDSEIHRVVIFNRVDNFHERLHDLEVRIFNEDDEFKDPNNLCGRFEGVVPGPMAPGGDGGAVVIDCATPLKGGIVSVQIRRDDAILTVCEIQVFQWSSDVMLNQLSMPPPVIPWDVEDPSCVDHEPSCRMWANGGECWKNEAWMKKHCPRSCEVCRKQKCHDFDDECPRLAAAGECKSNALWMASNCPVSCKTCDEVCVDFHQNCPAWAMLNECDKNPGFMHVNCRKSCRVCGDPECVDEDKRCASWKSANDCMKYPDWMTKHCPNSCNGCTNKCVDTSANCPLWAAEKECLFNPEWMGMFCRKSCDTCLPGTKAVCEDKNERCSSWAQDGICETNPDFMMKKCERSCGACGPLKPTIDPNGCYDKKKDCVYWEALGECDGKFKDFMEENCPRSCLICTDEKPKCEDKKENCPTWVMNGDCVTNAGWMWENCRKSCGICGDNQDCIEADNRCAQWAREGECEKNPRFMLRSCQKSCGVCDEDHVCKNEKGDRCYPWAHTGQCTADPSFMNKYCRKACNQCGCFDHQANCASWAEAGECENNPGWMKLSCRKSCGTCDDGSGGESVTSRPVTKPVTKPTSGGVTSGLVTPKPTSKRPVVTEAPTKKPVVTKAPTKRPVVTKAPTKRPVVTAEPGTPCFDNNQDCRKFAKEGLCEDTGSWGDWMREYCGRACAFCDATTAPHDKDCVDVDPRCPQYESLGRCEQWPEWVWQYCRKSCGFCN